MATHRLETYWEVLFDNGDVKEINFPKGGVYYFYEQKNKYLVSWLEEMILKENITAKPLTITKKYRVVECEPYDIVIGV